MKPMLCPVCEGTGIYTKVVNHCSLSGCCGEEVDTQCHGCDGDGWVQVEECDCEPCKCPCHDHPVYPPYYFPTPNYVPYPNWAPPYTTITC